MGTVFSDTSDLAEFRNFVYDSYTATHKHFSKKEQGVSVGRALQLEALLRKGLPPDRQAPILDFGCGDGVTLSVAEKLGYSRLYGVDLCQALLERASGRTSATLSHGLGLDYLKSCADGAFEAILAFDVFEHLTRPELLATCREIARTLKPGGRLLIHVPNGASPYCGGILWGDVTHERPYTKTALAAVLLPLGFDKIEASEVTPVPHGIFSFIRAALWQVFRTGMVIRVAVETGAYKDLLFTINMFVTARKASE